MFAEYCGMMLVDLKLEGLNQWHQDLRQERSCVSTVVQALQGALVLVWFDIQCNICQDCARVCTKWHQLGVTKNDQNVKISKRVTIYKVDHSKCEIGDNDLYTIHQRKWVRIGDYDLNNHDKITTSMEIYCRGLLMKGDEV